MRVLAGLAALLFAYLALIPGGLIFSVWDSACSGGGCETSLTSRVAFTLIYGLCLVAVAGTAAAFAAHAFRGTLESQERLPRALAGSAVVIGGATFVLFCVAFPLGGAIAAALAGAGFAALRLCGRERGGTRGPAELGRVNGHGPTG